MRRPGAAFQWQHDVKAGPDSTVSMFDDHCCQLTGGGTSVPATGPSRGLVLKLNEQTHTATVLSQYSGGNEFETEYMGDTQPLPRGNVFVGWGSEPYLSEYSQSGKLLFEGRFPGADLSYRSTLEQWVGLPLTPPVGAARHTGATTTVYASWNGATRLASWRVLAGKTAGALKVVRKGDTKSGFETAITVPAGYETFELQALDAAGHVIGASLPFNAK
jgi:Arylsulfotransferase (ASST)